MFKGQVGHIKVKRKLLSRGTSLDKLASLVAWMLQYLHAVWETWVQPPGEGNDNPLQYSCLENATDWGALWATVHGVTHSLT